MNKLKWPIDKLTPWEKNSRKTTDEHMMRLRNQIQLLGEYKPIVITHEGIVIAGNHRLQALKEIGHKEAWVSVIEFIQADDSLWYAVLDGEKKEKGFTSKEAGMMEYSLSDNDSVAWYDEDQLITSLSDLEIDESLYNVNLLESTSLLDIDTEDVTKETQPSTNNGSELVEETTPEEPEEKKDKLWHLTIKHEDQASLASLQEHLTSQGWNCELT